MTVTQNEKAYGEYFLKTATKKKVIGEVVFVDSNEIVAQKLNTKEDPLQTYYDAINVRCIDHICVYDEKEDFDLEFIVDDEGLFSSDNPVYEINLTVNGVKKEFNIAGSFLIGTTYDTEDGKSFTGFETEKSLYERLAKYSLTIGLIGFTR